MDRRSFLKVTLQATGSAAAFAGVTGAAAAATPAAPVALRPDARLLTVSVRGLDGGPGQADLLDRMALRLAAASGGRLGLVVDRERAPSAVDGSFGSLTSLFADHPATSFFAGLPGGTSGFGAERFIAWMSCGGGDMHADDLMARYGGKLLLAGFSGVPSRLWFAGPKPGSLAGLKIAVAGLGAEVVARLGAEAVALPADVIASALADGRIDAADVDGPLTALALGLPGIAQSVATSGLHGAGLASGLILRRDVWDGLAADEQALLELVTGEATRSAMARQIGHAGILTQVLASIGAAEWRLPASMRDALDAHAAEAVAEIAAFDEDSRRIAASHAAFVASFEAPAATV